MGDVGFRMDQAAWIAFSAFAPRSRERGGMWVAWWVFPPGCQVPPMDKSNLPYQQPAPRAGSKSRRSSLEEKKQNKKKKKFSRSLGAIRWGVGHPEAGSGRPWATFWGASVSVKQMSPANIRAVDFFSGAQGCFRLIEHLGNQEIRSHLGCCAEIGIT